MKIRTQKDVRTDVKPHAIERFSLRALDYANTARQYINYARRTGFTVMHKADKSYVTNIDREVEMQLRKLIEADYPDHGIIGEEYPPTRSAAPYQWIMDPIDGTEDFVRGVPTFGSILALYYRNAPLVGIIDHPALDLRVNAAFGHGTFRNGERLRLNDLAADCTDQVRLTLSPRANFIRHVDEGQYFDALTRRFPNHHIYCSCFGHTCVVTGMADIAVEFGNRVWDLAASRITVEEAGGAYHPLCELEIPEIGRVYGAVFGKRALVLEVAEMYERSVDAQKGV